MKRILYLLLFTVCFFSLSFSSLTTETDLVYTVREPKVKIAHPKMLLLLHGYGSNELDLFSFKDQLPDNYLVVSVRAPFVLKQGGYAWYSLNTVNGKRIHNEKEAQISKDKLISLLGTLKVKFQYDEQKVVLMGFSQGAIMSYLLGLEHPDKIRGIACMSGRLLASVKPGAKVNSLEVFISHGINDPVISVDEARKSKVQLNKWSIVPEYHEYQAVHEINDTMFRDFLKWLK